LLFVVLWQSTYSTTLETHPTFIIPGLEIIIKLHLYPFLGHMSLKSLSLFDVKQLSQEFMDQIDKAKPKKNPQRNPKHLI
jgi:hypothetical protein